MRNWFVASNLSGVDQSSRFVEEGIWENDAPDKFAEIVKVKSIQIGDRIVLKTYHLRRNDLPFEVTSQHRKCSVMTVQASGVVTDNPDDGLRLKVDWNKVFDPPREWFFCTSPHRIWEVTGNRWQTKELLEFVFEDKNQDIERYRNSPYWKSQLGGSDGKMKYFRWAESYQSIADELLKFKDRRDELVACIHNIVAKVGLTEVRDKHADGSFKPLDDICPFTTFGFFNRNLNETKRTTIVKKLANFLGVTEPVPYSFEGLPILDSRNSWFFQYKADRGPGDIDLLWEVFEKAIQFTNSNDEQTRSALITAYDDAVALKGVSWNLTSGLFWIRPWDFTTLDQKTRTYLRNVLKFEVPTSDSQNRCSGEDYLNVVDRLVERFSDDDFPVHSFPDLSLAAFERKDPVIDTTSNDGTIIDVGPAYGVDSIVNDGCFIEREKLESTLIRLREKKNLILQGPPGTGKTWLAKRLAYALIGKRDRTRVSAFQFHPNLSYEDFIRGWRPSGEGKLELVDGPFLKIADRARDDQDEKYVAVIEEINRGNPAQIFGEVLTLLEEDKRTPDEALELSHSQSGDLVYLPENLYVIGTMNIADRSLALVDLALRRRFAFIDLEPAINDTWKSWVHSKCNIEEAILNQIRMRLNDLNEQIADDSGLGSQYRIGHSFVTPTKEISNPRNWFRQVVESEIAPLLDELWFDNLQKSTEAKDKLLKDF